MARDPGRGECRVQAGGGGHGYSVGDEANGCGTPVGGIPDPGLRGTGDHTHDPYALSLHPAQPTICAVYPLGARPTPSPPPHTALPPPAPAQGPTPTPHTRSPISPWPAPAQGPTPSPPHTHSPTSPWPAPVQGLKLKPPTHSPTSHWSAPAQGPKPSHLPSMCVPACCMHAWSV